MSRWIEKIIHVTPERDSEEFSKFEALMLALHWEHWPTNVDGEQLDRGDYGDEARDESIELPSGQAEVFDFLDELGAFDNL